MKKVILYGAGLVAKEMHRYLGRCHPDTQVACFAVTSREGQAEHWGGVPVLGIREALDRHPDASVVLALQEKFHPEVRKLLDSLGASIADAVGVRKMTALLKEEGIREINERCGRELVSGDPFDCTMIAVRHPRCAPGHVYKLLPLTQLPLREAGHAMLEQLDRNEEKLEELMGKYLLPEDFKEESPLNRTVFVGKACSGKDAPLGSDHAHSDCVHSVLAGAVLQDGGCKQEYRDDHGENLSRANRDYAELSVTYWMWKNVQADYLGLCHYRRHFVMDRHAMNLLRSGAVDVVLTRPRLTFPSVREYFVDFPITNLREGDYRLMMEAVRNADPECGKYAEKVFSGVVHYPNNMVIAKREIFSSYCEWMFSILAGMEKFYHEKKISRNDRYLAYAGEMLTTLYFMHHHKEWKRMYVDYELLY